MGKKSGKKAPVQPSPPAGESADAFAVGWQRNAIRGLLLLAMASALYLLFVSLSSGSVAGCGPESGCDRVLRSRWAYWLGIPVSAPAFLAYASLFGLLTLYPRFSAARKRQTWALLMGVSVLVVCAAAWFVGLMLFAIKGFCPFCLAAHGSAAAAALGILRSVPVAAEPKSPAKKQKEIYVLPSVAKGCTIAGLAGIIVLIGGQMLFKKSGHLVKSLDQPGLLLTTLSHPPPQLSLTQSASLIPTQSAPSITAQTAAVSKTSSSSASPRVATNVAASPMASRKGRIITTHQGAFQFNLDEVPLLGSPEAPYVIISLFDYTCHHCHIMHAHLQTALQYFSNRLAIVSLPMPLDSACNPLIRRTHPTASNACVYARLGLAVWRANRQRFKQFDDYMFSRPTPPPVGEASDYAANLVGADALGRALSDPWIDQRLQANISLYHTNYLILQTGAMPQLVIGNKAVSGSLNSPGELIRLLNEHLVRAAGGTSLP